MVNFKEKEFITKIMGIHLKVIEIMDSYMVKVLNLKIIHPNTLFIKVVINKVKNMGKENTVEMKKTIQGNIKMMSLRDMDYFIEIMGIITQDNGKII